ncbi:MAG: glycosyltransferase [Oscillospiraceae bacterium]|nr:glycosyltransferase [Oscillospiraceae bacterium]
MSNNFGSAREQFEQEANQLKQIIYQLIDGGQIIMAAQMLEQYAILNPTDPDLDDLRGMLYPDGNQLMEEEIPEDYKILNNIETIFILSGIITKRTGYIDSVLRKIKLMEEKWNYKPVLMTCIHNIDQRQSQAWLGTAGIGQVTLGAETRVLNVYEYFQKSYVEGLENKAVYSDSDKDGIPEDDTANETKKYYTGYMGSLRTVRYFKDGNPIKDMVYDDWGYLNYVRQYSPLSEDIYDIKYYTTDGKICIEALFRPTSEGIEHEKIFLYNDNEEIIFECKSSAELAAYCLNQIIDESKFYMLVVEDGLMSKAVTEIDSKKKNVAKCIVVHSIFLNDAYDKKSGPQKFYEYLCNNHKKFDGIIMLTKDAADDFKQIYGGAEKLFVSPHPYPHIISKVDFSKRDPMKAAVVARLDPLKQINLTIDIFALVVKELPEAKLDIYGKGPEQENLENKIKALGMENNIFLKGYTDEPLVTFNTAVLSIVTSAAEGYGLTIMESICNGCPPFAFDIKYGPAEIIEDNKTGFLFPRFDLAKCAKKIVEYLKDPQLQKTMSENCYNAASRFNTDNFLKNWFSITEILYEQKNRRN